jgi:hypothetical protein
MTQQEAQAAEEVAAEEALGAQATDEFAEGQAKVPTFTHLRYSRSRFCHLWYTTRRRCQGPALRRARHPERGGGTERRRRFAVGSTWTGWGSIPVVFPLGCLVTRRCTRGSGDRFGALDGVQTTRRARLALTWPWSALSRASSWRPPRY